MAGRKSRRQPPSRSLPLAGTSRWRGLLDWSASSHWSTVALPCRYCDGTPTHLRDSKGKPAHKVCAESRITEQIAEYAESYEQERLRSP